MATAVDWITLGIQAMLLGKLERNVCWHLLEQSQS